MSPAKGPARASGSAVAPTRGDRVHQLIQALADLDADAEGREHRPAPRLDNDLALADQLRVMVLDLLATPAPDDLLTQATALTTEAANSL